MVILSAPPTELCPALRELALAAFRLEERLQMSDAHVAQQIDAEIWAFARAQRAARDAFRQWEPVA